MSTTTTTTTAAGSTKQRKLVDLRVVDLHRELRSLGIPYDKKELKGVLFDKLRQSLINRNFDPDMYLFDIPTDIKSVTSDDYIRSHDENGSHETNSLDTSSSVEIDSEQRTNGSEHTVQTTTTTSSKLSTTTPLIDNDEDTNEKSRMDTIDLQQIVEDRDKDNIFLTIAVDDDTPTLSIDENKIDEQKSTTIDEDENNNNNNNSINDIGNHGLVLVSCSSSDEEFNSNKQQQQQNPTNSHLKSTSTIAEQMSSSSVDHQPENSSSSDLSTNSKLPENVPVFESDLNREQIKQTTTTTSMTKSNKSDTCQLWVSNIAKETHASDLKALFSKHGKVLTTKVVGSGGSQWYGYITLQTPEDADRCIATLHQTELHGKTIYVDREMYESPSKSKTSSSTSTHHSKSTSSDSHRKSSMNDSYKKRDSIPRDKPVTTVSPKKRTASSTTDSKKKIATSDVIKSSSADKPVKTPEVSLVSEVKKSTEVPKDKQRTSSSSSSSQSTKQPVAKAPEKPDTARNDRKSDKTVSKPSTPNAATSSANVTNTPKSSNAKTSSPIRHRSRSIERRTGPPSDKISANNFDKHRSSSADKSKPRPIVRPNHPQTSAKSKEITVAAAVRSTADATKIDRRTAQLRHEKELLFRKQYVQQQEEEKIKEQQRRLAEERERMRREYELLERERLEVERGRLALEKEKQEQARELEKQQRRLADEAKHRQQQAEAKIRDEKLRRISHTDNKRPRSSHRESPRSHHTNTSSSSNSTKGYDHRPSSSMTNPASGHVRDRSTNETNHDYYPEPKRQYTAAANTQREAIFHDRVVYRDPDLPNSAPGLVLGAGQRYLPPSSNPHRLSDPYSNMPQRAREMPLPSSSTSSMSNAYERTSRAGGASPSNAAPMLRRGHSRERFDEREYLQQSQRRDRSPPPNTTGLRREPMDTTHWERPKPREASLYTDDGHKYLPTQYLSETSQSGQHQQGLWSSAPPSRQPHHHPDLSVKTALHAAVVDPYGWPHVSQQGPPPPHHPQDRSRAGVTSNQRIPILSSNQPPPPPPPASRSTVPGQAHLYTHPGIPVNTLPSSQQQHAPPPPPPSLHHPAAYVTQQAPPAGLVLHPTAPTRGYEQHYVVTQALPPQRRY